MQDTILDSRSAAVTLNAGALPQGRWLCLAVLLGVEILLLNLLFDANDFYRDPRWWAALMGYSPRVPRIVSTMAVATLIFGGQRLRSGLERHSNHRDWPRHAGFLLAGHLIAFACFAVLTAWLWDESVHPTPFGCGKMIRLGDGWAWRPPPSGRRRPCRTVFWMGIARRGALGPGDRGVDRRHRLGDRSTRPSRSGPR